MTRETWKVEDQRLEGGISALCLFCFLLLVGGPNEGISAPGPYDKSSTPFVSIYVCVHASIKIKIFCWHWFHVIISCIFGNVGAVVLMVSLHFSLVPIIVEKNPKNQLLSPLCANMPVLGLRLGSWATFVTGSSTLMALLAYF